MKRIIGVASDEDLVVFVDGRSTISEGLERHGPSEMLKRSVGELREDFRAVVSQILAITQDTPSDAALTLKEIEVGLGFSAEGELGFIAKAKVGVEATISLRFERSHLGDA